MVQAILAGNKTQTRREVKDISPASIYLMKSLMGEAFLEHTEFKKPKEEQMASVVSCPYGNAGDTLWVRESYTQNGLNYFRYKADWGNNKYPTGEPEGTFINKSVPVNFRGKWKPSIHMPFVSCRIFLKIKSIRVERLQKISEEDAKAEGVLLHERGKHYLDYLKQKHGLTQFIYACRTAKESYKTLWEVINKDEFDNPARWQANPWVWVIEFERTEKPSTQTKPQPQLVYCKNCGKERVGEVH